MIRRFTRGLFTPRRCIPFAAGVVCTALVACGSGGVDGGGTGPKPQIAIALDPGGATLAQGASTSLSARVTGSNGFTGPATIVVTGGPTGVKPSVSSPQSAGNVIESTVRIDVGATVVPGTYSLMVTASGAGVASISASFALTVTAAPVTGGFALSTSPGTVTLAQGSSATDTITISRTGGFTGSVGLAASGMSNGLTATFNPASAAGGSATLALTANSVATPGTVTLTIGGGATGLSSQVTNVQVTVVASPAGGASGNVVVDYTGCGAGQKPVWFVYQDGDGVWTRVTATNDVFRFTISNNAGGYAYATRAGADSSAVSVSLLSRSELTAAPIIVCPVPAGNKTVTATVTPVGTSQQAVVNLGGSSVDVFTSNVVSIPKVPNGTYDLVAWRFNNVRGINTASDTKPVIIRDVNVAEGESAGSVNFGAPDAIVPVAWSVVFTGVNVGDTFTGSMSYYTGPRESCTAAQLYKFSTTSPSVPASAYGFPESAQRPTDFHVLRVVDSNFPVTRVFQQSFHAAGSITSLNLAAAVSTPTISDLGGIAYKRLQAVGATPAAYSSTVTFSYTDAGVGKSAAIQASIAWLGGNAATLAFPDFSGVSGWDNSWMPAATSSVGWTFGGTGATYAGLPCVDGGALWAAYYSGTK